MCIPLRYWGSILGVIVMITGAAQAQETRPPGCCPLEMPASIPEMKQSEILISADAASLMGLSRGQLVDRLSLSFFPDKQVSLIISRTSTRLVSTPAPGSGVAGGASGSDPANPAGLVAVQEKRFYQVPRADVEDQELNALDQLHVTDGQFFLRLTFIQGDSWIAGR